MNFFKKMFAIVLIFILAFSPMTVLASGITVEIDGLLHLQGNNL